MRTRHAGQSALLFLDVVEILQREKVDYAVIGAFALSVHGVVRGTMDVDAVLSTSMRQLANLSAVFERAGFSSELRRGDPDDPIPAMLVLRDAHENRVELLGGLRGMDPELFARTIEVPLMGVNLRIVGREDFIAMKAFAGGPMDIVDATRAIAAARNSLDVELLRRLTKRYGRDALALIERLLAS